MKGVQTKLHLITMSLLTLMMVPVSQRSGGVQTKLLAIMLKALMLMIIRATISTAFVRAVLRE